MNGLKVVAWVAGGLATGAAIGGGVYWWRRRKAAGVRGVPSRPKRVVPSEPAASEEDTRARGHYVARGDLPDEFVELLNKEFPGGWPADDSTIKSMQRDDVVVFAVESDPAGPYEHPREELIQARVLSVEKTVVRARVLGPVAHAEHHGSHAGHGFRVGDLAEVPFSKVLVAARRAQPKGEGYNSEGEPARTFKPSDLTGETYKVRPQTPYDLVPAYRTDELEWHVDRELVKMTRIGARGPFEQIMFSEDSLRGPVSVRAIDNDPDEGYILVGRWDFVLDA